jgi:anaerobic selenocysteine-containing dehydrogenase
VLIETEAGSVRIEAEVTDSSHRGQVVIPHGFGLVHGGETHGANVNRLAPAKHRDRLAATPLHRYIPCRVRKASFVETIPHPFTPSGETVS